MSANPAPLPQQHSNHAHMHASEVCWIANQFNLTLCLHICIFIQQSDKHCQHMVVPGLQNDGSLTIFSKTNYLWCYAYSALACVPDSVYRHVFFQSLEFYSNIRCMNMNTSAQFVVFDL